MPRLSRKFYIPIVGLWLGIAVSGLSSLAKYRFAPGASAAVTHSDWPAQSALARPANKYFLLVFVHPQCPCTEATISELDKLMTHTAGKLSTTVAFVVPSGVLPGFEKGSLWTASARIPGVMNVCDFSGLEAQRFGAATSGQTFLFNTNGQMIFHGGITDGRGHEGDNVGSESVVNLVMGKTAESTQTPVFGCALFDPLKDRVGGATWQRQ
jgi:hypothetical protein